MLDAGIRQVRISTGLYLKILELPKREFDGREMRRRWRVHPFLVGVIDGRGWRREIEIVESVDWDGKRLKRYSIVRREDIED